MTDVNQHWYSRDMAPAWMLAVIAVFLQMATNGRYGYFRDELYYLALSHHLAWGYVDMAPMAPLVAFIGRILFGESMHAIRLLPALALGTEILITGLIAHELGGKRFAIFLSCLAVLVAPVIVNNASRFSMNPFEALFWMGAVYFLLRAINRDQPKQLVWVGVLLGLGLENKHSTAFFLVSLLVGIIATSERRFFKSKWFWISAAIVVLLALPNLIWQYQHDFATWVDLSNVKKTHKNVELPTVDFLKQQVMTLLLLNAFIWISGLLFVLFHRRGKRYRVLGITYLAFLVIMNALHGKDYYLAPIYPMLFAAGGVYWQIFFEAHARLRWMKVAFPVALAIMGIVAFPLVLPILPPERIVPYMHALGVGVSRSETNMESELPQHFADEFGWQEMVAQVAQVYNSMPPDLRAKTAILGGDYGSAGAIDFFGAQYGLPKSISAHQNYYYWGFRDYTGESLIMLNWQLDDAEYWCNDVEEGPKVWHPYSMGWEHYNILICHGLKKPIAEVWPHIKVWN